MHQVGSDQPREREWFDRDRSGVMSQAQQQKRNQRNGNLSAHGVLGGSQEVSDLQGLFDPSAEQLDSPSTLVQSGDFLRACSQIVAEDTQDFAGLDDRPYF